MKSLNFEGKLKLLSEYIASTTYLKLPQLRFSWSMNLCVISRKHMHAHACAVLFYMYSTYVVDSLDYK